MAETNEKMNIYEAHRQPPKEALKTIQAGRLKGMSDINPMWRIKALTEEFGACGIGWYYTSDEQRIESCGDEKVAIVNISLYIKNGSEWSKPIFGTGGAKIITKEKSGLYVNDEAFKMATTDAISVACKQLGFAADIYWQTDRDKYTANDNPNNAKTNDAQKNQEMINNVNPDLLPDPNRTQKYMMEKLKAEGKRTGKNDATILKTAGINDWSEITDAKYISLMNLFAKL